MKGEQKSKGQLLKELACLYKVSREMQKDLSFDEICQNTVEHLVPAMRFPEITIPMIEIEGKRFTSENFTEGLSHGLHSDIMCEGKIQGQLWIYFAEERPFSFPEEQNLVDGVAEAIGMCLERRRMEEALQESEKKYRTLTETVLDGIYIITQEGFEYVNPAFEEIFGYKQKEICGKDFNFLDLIQPEDRKLIVERVEALKNGKILFPKYSFRVLTKDGQIKYVEVNTVPIPGKRTRILGVLRDISDRVKTEKDIKMRRRELQRLSVQLLNTQELERKKIALELHDEIGQALTAININIATIEKELPAELTPMIRERLIESRSLARRTLQQIRELSLDLRPSMLDDLGLLPAVRWYVNSFSRRLNIEVEFKWTGFDKRLETEMETTLYRIIQEALTNVARHAQAGMVRVLLECRECDVTALIEDDGQGFDVQEILGRDISEHGIGLLGIRERVSLMGGNFDIHSQPGRGTRLSVEIPLGDRS